MRSLGKDSVPAIIRKTDDNAAALTVVQTNLEQREKLLPSEKAFAYKLMMDTYKNHMHPSDTNCFVESSTGWTGDSSMAYYYIRLTELLPEILRFVDEEKIPVKAGVELSYMDAAAQQAVWQYFFNDTSDEKLSVKTASAIRAAYDAGKQVTMDSIPEIIINMMAKKKVTKGCSISSKLLKRYAIPEGVDLVRVVCELLEERFGRV